MTADIAAVGVDETTGDAERSRPQDVPRQVWDETWDRGGKERDRADDCLPTFRLIRDILILRWSEEAAGRLQNGCNLGTEGPDC